MDWSQKKRRFRLTTPLGADVMLMVRWEGEEHVSSFFRFIVTAFSARTDISAKDLLLKKVTIESQLPDGTYRSIHGIVSRLTRGGVAPEGYAGYVLEIVPPHFALALDEGFEIFQNLSARDICDKLLTGTPHDWKLIGTPTPRPYCFRYRESRWTCASRLLEQEGIFYRYDHRSGEAKLILCDSVASAQPAWGVSQLEYHEAEMNAPRLLALQVESVPYVAETRVRTASEFLATNNISDVTPASGKFHPPADIKAYRFEQQLASQRTGISHSGGAVASDAAKLPPDVKAVSRLRQELAETMSVCYSGTTRYAGLETGSKTDIVKHPYDVMNVAVFITSVWHEGSNGSYGGGDGEQAYYQNQFVGIPAGTPYRPARSTPWPHVGGSHVAHVVGPAGEEIYTDKHGRIQVVFKWDLDASTALEHSCWVRVAQSFAGQQFGSVWLPRIGHEVIVEFLDGNPDNPVVVGSLYNSANLPPWALPDHKTQSGVKTKSTLKGGAENYNQVRFEDKKGSEHINVQAEKDLITLVKNDETRTVGHDRVTKIKNDETKTVEEGNETTTIKKGWQKITVADNDRTLHVAKNHIVAVDVDETISIGGDRVVSIDGEQTHSIKKDNTVKIDGKQTRTIKQDDKTTVSMGNATREVSMGNIKEEAKLGNISIKADVGSITIEALQGITLKCGPTSSITMSPQGIVISGLQFQAEGIVQAEVKGVIVQVNAKAMLMAKGAITMIG